MRIHEIAIECYGIFEDRDWTFAPGFQVLYGPNEAGKSTLLQLLRELLFGFPHRSPYVFSHHRIDMAARATLDLADGRRVTYRRRKGRQATVRGELHPGNEPVDEQSLRQLLGGASADLYQRVFAFSLVDLAAGEAGLAHAELREALFGVGLGGMARFRALQDEIESTLGDIYSPRARTRPKINKLLAEIQDNKLQLRDAAVRPQDYRQLISAQQAERTRIKELRVQLEQQHRNLDRLERMQQALPLQEQLGTTLREQSLLQVPTGFPPDGGDELLRQNQRRLELQDELQQLQHEHDNLQSELDLLASHDLLLAAAPQIDRLCQQLTQYEQCLNSLPVLTQELRELSAEMDDLTQQLSQGGAQVFDDSKAHWSLHLAQLAELERHDQQLREAQLTLGSQMPPLTQDIERLEQQLHAIPPLEEIAPWQTVLDHQAELLQSLQRETDLAAQLESARRKLDQRAQQLMPQLRDPTLDLAKITVPLDSLVQHYADQAADLHQRRAEMQRQQRELQASFQDQRLAWQQMLASQGVPDLRQLEAARQHRDRGWQLIRDQLFGGQDQTDQLVKWSAPYGTPAEAFTVALQEVDHLYERRQAGAEQVARQEQHRHAMELLEERLLGLQRVEREIDQQQTHWQTEWQTLWMACQVVPQEPACMLQWLERYADWSDQRELVASLQQQLNQVQAARGDREQPIRELLNDLTTPVLDLLRRVSARCEEIRTRRLEHERLHRELLRRQEQWRALQQQVVEQEQERAKWNAAWLQLLKQLRFPADWPVSTVRSALVLHESLREKRARAELARDKEREQSAFLETFAAAVQPLLPLLADTDETTSSRIDSVRRLHQRLQQAQICEERRRGLHVEQIRLSKLLENKQRAIERIELRRRELLALAQVEDDLAFAQVADAAARSYQLARQSAEIRRHIDTTIGNHDPESFWSDLAAMDPARLTSLIELATAHRQSLDEEYQRAVANQALHEERLQLWSGQCRTLEIANQLEAKRSQLRDLVEEWGPLALAKASMQLALERFEREHQPALLAEVNRIFQRFTQGRYVAVRRHIRDEPSLVVETSQGLERELDQLSTGTREQLYLAVRLAFVDRYCRRAEPLPLVMDDVLVNFDDRRSRETLEVLGELGEDHQILFLTCHESTVRLAQQILPDVMVHRLTPAAVPSAEASSLR